MLSNERTIHTDHVRRQNNRRKPTIYDAFQNFAEKLKPYVQGEPANEEMLIAYDALRVPTLADCVNFAGSITTENKQVVCLQHASKSDSHPGHQFFLLKMNELLGRFFPCTSGVPHFAKERADRDSRR